MAFALSCNGLYFDRSIYTNIRGNIQHDSYMIFPNYSFTPLKLQWQSDYATDKFCFHTAPNPTMVFANGIIYCITNAEMNGGLNNYNQHIVAINVTDNGNVIWKQETYGSEKMES